MSEPSRPEPDLTQRTTFPFWSEEKIRFGDIDRQNHVNNLAVCSYIESGRVEFREREFPEFARDQSISWLVVNFEIAFKAAIGYPGTVDVGTGVTRIGTSSYVLGHAAFSGSLCIATAKT
ncbi:MAG TPA: acyl-CoA thioesterase, partial [Hyphomicrobiaceae bacterium]|nr:acyl-CoA thioesterase [Hyphomicrobiaceae bacterium]